jgi:hypothetical protein
LLLRFFLGKNKVMQLALGKTPEDEQKSGLANLARVRNMQHSGATRHSRLRLPSRAARSLLAFRLLLPCRAPTDHLRHSRSSVHRQVSG